MIEFINRVFTGFVSIAVILAVLGSLRLAERRRDLTWLSLGLVCGVIGQIVLGGLVVLFHLNPWLVLGHFALSMVLVANAVVLHQRAHPDSPSIGVLTAGQAALARTMIAAALAVITTGMLTTGSGPHSGTHEDDFVERLPFAVHSIARIHGVSMIVFLAVTAALAYSLRAAPEAPARRDLSTVLAILVVQAGIGYTQYFMGVPAGLVALHIAGVTLLWITLVRFFVRHCRTVAITAPRAETYRYVAEPDTR